MNGIHKKARNVGSDGRQSEFELYIAALYMLYNMVGSENRSPNKSAKS